MKFTVSLWYLTTLFILWTAPVVTAIWQVPIWMTVSLMAFFAIYAGHEWAHALVCSINNIEIERISLVAGGHTHIIFLIDDDDPNYDKNAADIYLAGAVWDSVWFTIPVLSSFFYALYFHDPTALIFAISLIFVLIANLAFPGSDWQEYLKRTTTRA
jgi:hypothetical protein